MNTSVKNVEIKEFPLNLDPRGSLCFFEAENHVPFSFNRVFYVFDTPKGSIRGHHAHKESWQVHVCLGGSARVIVDDGKNKQEIVIDKPNMALIIGPMVWHSFELEEGAKFFVVSSNTYSEEDYIRDYNEFKMLTA